MPVLTNDCPDTRARAFLTRAAVLIVAAIAPRTVWAVCTCGFQAALEDPINGTIDTNLCMRVSDLGIAGSGSPQAEFTFRAIID